MCAYHARFGFTAVGLNEWLLHSATGRRHGIVLEPSVVPSTPADLPGLFNVAVPSVPDLGAAPASGGIGRTVEAATVSAIGEALERYAGSLAQLPICAADDPALGLRDFSLFSEAQRSRDDFPHPDLYAGEPPLTDVYDLCTNQRVPVPAALVSLDRRHGGISTSSGLAAHPNKATALLRALQELVERDALMTTWMHGVVGRRVAVPGPYTGPVVALGGEVIAIDATPAYSPHPVAIVMGQVPHRGRMRFTLGAACRSTWVDALEKAYLEWAQGLTFVADRLVRDPNRRLVPNDCTNFDAHALYYTYNPHEWARLPVVAGEGLHPEPASGDSVSDDAQLEELVFALASAGIRTMYRNMTTVDLEQLGITAVRVLSPQLVPVHHDHRYPHLGGTSADLAMRYPWATGTVYPSPFPHPLG